MKRQSGAAIQRGWKAAMVTLYHCFVIRCSLARTFRLRQSVVWLGVFTVVGSVSSSEPSDNTKRLRYAIALHGGAGSFTEPLSAEENKSRREALAKALTKGREILTSGGTSLDAVETVIRSLEDDPMFNAGKGAVLNADGGFELDASIMDGGTLACGAVAGVTTAKNPISLARLVMTKTRHVLLSGPGADRFAEEMGVVRVPQEYFWTQRRFDAWQRARREQEKAPDEQPRQRYMGTVGCAALDSHGSLAAGTSTGGRTNKKFGRVGDSPIIGAGTYADNKTCAVSCTGIGEEFIRHQIAYEVSALMKYPGFTLQQSVLRVIHETLKPNDGGLIAVGRDGSISMEFNTADMARAAADSTGRFEVLGGDR